MRTTGFSMVELLLVLAVAGIIAGIVVPGVSGALNRIEVRAAAGHIAAAHHRARMMAITQSRVLILSVDSLALTIRPRGTVTALWSEPGPATNGIALAGPGRSFIFSPEGFSLGFSNATLRLSRRAATRSVIISRLGRVRITP